MDSSKTVSQIFHRQNLKATHYFTCASLMKTIQILQHCLLPTVKCCKSHPNSHKSFFPAVPSVYYLPCDTQSHCQLLLLYVVSVGRDSSVGIATRYGLHGPGIESRWGRDFSHPSRQALGPIQPPIQWVPGLFLGVKRPGRDDHPPHLAPKLKKE